MRDQIRLTQFGWGIRQGIINVVHSSLSNSTYFLFDECMILYRRIDLGMVIVRRSRGGVIPTPITIIVAHRNPMAAQVLCCALRGQRKHFAVVGCVHTPEELLKQVSEHHPDIAVISSILQGDPDGGLKVVRELRVSGTTTRPIVLLEFSDAKQVFDAFSAGAKGVVCQTDPFEAMCKCVRCVHAGQIWADSTQLQGIFKTLAEREPARIVSAKGIPLLTKREEQIAHMVAEGLPNREISAKLGVTLYTVKNHLFRIYGKLGISNRVELVLYALSSRQSKASP
ncbi:MAG: response regulator transcription factor [Terriglobia bacterium]